MKYLLALTLFYFVSICGFCQDSLKTISENPKQEEKVYSKVSFEYNYKYGVGNWDNSFIRKFPASFNIDDLQFTYTGQSINRGFYFGINYHIFERLSVGLRFETDIFKLDSLSTSDASGGIISFSEGWNIFGGHLNLPISFNILNHEKVNFGLTYSPGVNLFNKVFTSEPEPYKYFHQGSAYFSYKIKPHTEIVLTGTADLRKYSDIQEINGVTNTTETSILGYYGSIGIRQRLLKL